MLGTEGLVLSVGVPVIMGLIMFMVLVEGVVQVTVDPVELGDMTQEVGHLGVLIGRVFVPSSDGVEGLVDIRVDYLVSEVVVALLPEVFRDVR